LSVIARELQQSAATGEQLQEHIIAQIRPRLIALGRSLILIVGQDDQEVWLGGHRRNARRTNQQTK
jgi:hypothetical protein